jgi:hypothetical protein
MDGLVFMFSKYTRPTAPENKKASVTEQPPISFIDLETTETPRSILEEDFPRLAPLPISGGWGYSMETACVIDKNDPALDPNLPFNGVDYEYLFAEHRLYEELIIFRPKDQQFAGINFRRTRQNVREHEGRHFDVMTFDVSAFREVDFDRLKALYEGPDGIEDPAFDHEKHESLRASLIHTGERTYWFDITSFYGR